jgi:hypothetical protein
MGHRALLGRSRELTDLEGALDRAASGRGGVYLLSGEAGIGKTRLCAELADVAEARGVHSVWGRAWEVEGAPACWPWVQALDACARVPAGAEFVERDPQGADLAPLLPRLRPSSGSSGGAPAPELDALRVASAIVALLRRLSAAGPLLLVFDDLHAVDVASLTLLSLVARDLRGLRVLIVGTYREVEARRSPAVAALLARLAREGTARPLGRLEPASVAAWLADALGSAPSPALAQAVFAATEGNPLFVDALAQLLAARGQGAALPLAFALPDSVRETVHELLRPVPAWARGVLDAASVLGRECRVATLQLVCDAPLDEVLAAVGDGIAAGVLSPQPRASSPVRFAHVLIRETLYQALPPARRIDLHARCARALGRAHAGDIDAHLAELAHHCFESGPTGAWLDAADFCARAGQRAFDLLAFDDAARHFERALIALDHGESVDDARRAELLWRLGAAQIGLGQARLGRETCERATVLAERAGRPDIFARAALAFGSELVPARTDPRLAELLETALRLDPGADPALRAQMMARLAAAQMPRLDRTGPLQLARDAVALARTLGDRRVLAQVIGTGRSVMTSADDIGERTQLDRELAELAAVLADRRLALQAHSRLTLNALERADADAVERELRIQSELADDVRVPQQQIRAACTRLAWATLRGRDEDGARAEDEIRALADRVEEPRWLGVIESNRVTRAELRGDDAAAAAAFDAFERIMAGDIVAATGPAMWLRLRHAALFARDHRLDDVRAQIGGFAPEGPQQAYGAMGPALIVLMVPVAIALDERDWMQTLYDMLLPYAGRITFNMAVLVSDGPVDLYLGRLAVALGRGDDAARHLDDAARTCERAGFGPFGARVRRAIDELGRPAPAPAAAAVSPPQLRRDGELWLLSHDGRHARLRDSKGVHYLAALLREPGREFHVSDLVGATADAAPGEREVDARAAGLRVGRAGDAGELLDARAKAEYRRRLEQLDDALDDAEERGDRERAARIHGEREALARELARAVGLGGRDRRASSASERARINVQRRIRDVLTRVAEVDAVLARHLELHVKTGVFCSFQP